MIDSAHSAATTANPIIWTSQFMRPMLAQISVALTSTVLAVFGHEISGGVRNLIKKRPFLIRVSVFVILVAFGYGTLNLAISHQLSRLLVSTDDLWLSPLVLGAFIALGILAERNRQI